MAMRGERTDRPDLSARQGLAALLLITAALRLGVAALAPLSGDEAHYWLWSRDLQWSYFDHPGMVAYLIRAATTLFGLSELTLRLPSIVIAALVSVLVYDTARLAFASERVGLTAAVWLNATLLFAAAGVIITPDAPLQLCWSLCLWALVRLVHHGRTRDLLLAGLAAGLGVASKYTMALAGPGLLAAFLLFPALRQWWRRPALYGAAALALLAASPMVLWNLAHDNASFRKQASHAFDAGGVDSLASLATFVGGEAGVVTPLIFAFCLWGGGWALWHGWRERRADWFLLGGLSLPVLLFFAQHSLGGKVQLHWPGMAYLPAIIAAVGAWSSQRRAGWGERLFRLGPWLGGGLVGLAYLHLATGLLPLPARADPLGRLKGWPPLFAAVEAQHRAHPDAFLFVEKHDMAGLLSFHLADHPVVFLGKVALHNAPWAYGDERIPGLAGGDAIFVFRDGSGSLESSARFFESVTPLARVERPRRGREPETYALSLARGYRGGLLGED